MKRVIGQLRGWERVLTLALVVFILSAGVVVVLSVVRQSGLESDLDGSIGDLQEAAVVLEETVGELRSTTDDPAVLADLEAIEEQLQGVNQQLETLDENIDEPLFEDEVSDGTADEENVAAGEPVDREGFVFTVWAWVVGILSLLAACLLAYVLRRRWQRRQQRVLKVNLDLPIDSL